MSSDATDTLLGGDRAEREMSGRVPIDGHPGFYRSEGAAKGAVSFRYRDHRNRRRWASAPTVKAAIRRKAELEVDVRRGEYRVTSRETFASYARSWIDTYNGRTARGISETTRDDYRSELEQKAIPYFGRMRLSEIEPRDVKEYAAELAGKGLAPDTVRLAVAPVRVLFATALEEGAIRSNPAAGLRLAQRRPETVDGDGQECEVKAMSEQELQTLLAQIAEDAPEWRLFFDVLAWSGLRIGEAIELRWKDVDLGARTVHVRRRYADGRVGPPKSRYGRRRLRLTPELARALWTHRGGAGDDDLVFITFGRRDRAGGGGTRISPSNLMRRVLKPAAVEAGLGVWVPDPRDNRKLKAESWVGFHTFRHTCATVLFRRGWNAAQVQKWLGHHKPSFTLDTYVHLLDEDVPEPDFFDAISARAPAPAYQSAYHLAYQDGPKQPETAADGAAGKPRISTRNANGPRQAKTA